jgi:hypothetical protein
MSQVNVIDSGDQLLLDLSITRPGKLGIEFQQTASPYIVVRVSEEAQQLYSVIPGDHLVGLKSVKDTTWIKTDGLDWPGIVNVLKERPAFAQFERKKAHNAPDVSPKSGGSKELTKIHFDSKSPASRPTPVSSSNRGPFDTDPEDEAASFFNQVISTQSIPEIGPPIVPVTIPVSQTTPKRGPFDGSPRDASPTFMAASVNQRSVAAPVSVAKGSSSPKEVRVMPPELPIVRSSVSEVSPKSQPQSPPSMDRITIVYTTDGPLGLEFEEVDYPYKVRSIIAGSMSQEKGVRRGDCLVTVNGKSTEGMSWEQLRRELSSRPSHVEFSRTLASGTPRGANSSTPPIGGVWSLAANLVRGGSVETSSEMESLMRERDELRAIITSLNSEDIEALRYRANQTESVQLEFQKALVKMEMLEEQNRTLRGQVEEERVKNANLLHVVDSREKTQSDLMSRFESEISHRDKRILQLESDLTSLRSVSPQPGLDTMRDQIATYEARIELIEKDNSRLRKENTDLGVMVQQCLEKIQKDLADKPHWVDRRVVCGAVGTLLRDMDNIIDGTSNAIDAHATARQRLGDVLGLTFEERSAMGLLHVPEKYTKEKDIAGIGEDFVTFLQRETDTDTSNIGPKSPSVNMS